MPPVLILEGHIEQKYLSKHVLHLKLLKGEFSEKGALYLFFLPTLAFHNMMAKEIRSKQIQIARQSDVQCMLRDSTSITLFPYNNTDTELRLC